MPYNCQSEDGNLAAVLFTNLETGDVLAACPDCIPTYALALVESATGQSYEPVGEPVASPDADDEDQADEADQVEAPQTPPGVAPAPEGDPGGPADDDPADDKAGTTPAEDLAFLQETVDRAEAAARA